MRLKPRYSLLTLLVLTALFAGGVKLWYGPHHVVEQLAPGKELEYTYTQNWQGRMYQGPCIFRLHDSKGYPIYMFIIYFWQDKRIPCVYNLQSIDPDFEKLVGPSDYNIQIIRQMPLPKEEQLALEQTIERERVWKEQAPEDGYYWNERLFDLRPTYPNGEYPGFDEMKIYFQRL